MRFRNKMLEEIIKKSADMFKTSLSTIVITNKDYDIMWSNNTEFIELIEGENIKDLIGTSVDYDEFSNVITHAEINDKKYGTSISPIIVNSSIQGFKIQFASIKDVIDQKMNNNCAEYQVEYFSEIRTQVSGIISAATLLQDTLLQFELYDDLKVLNNQVNYCYKILASILNPAEINKYSYGAHNIVKINVSNFFGDVLSIIKTLLRGVNVNINSNIENDVYITVDPDRLVTLILNLVINSIQHNIEEEKNIDIRLKKSVNSCIFSVEDNGVGLSEQKINDIFERMIENKYSIFEINKGVGLGHQVITCFCKAFDAEVYLSSIENKYTKISFRIPLSKSDEAPYYMESKTADYLSNRFSNIYIAMSRVAQINFF